MALSTNNEAYDELLHEICTFVEQYPDPLLDKFRDAVANWGDRRIDVVGNYLPAAEFLVDGLSTGTEKTAKLLSAFAKYKASLRWEQSYKKSDGVVGDDMLSGYGFAEVIGKKGPFVSERIRAGIGVWGPSIRYPKHHHKAEEIYLVLGGFAEFAIGEDTPRARHAGEVVFVESMAPHEFKTLTEPLVIFYLWQAGDLRETSTFL